MIESASLKVCILDGTPPHESHVYRTLVESIGPRKANRWVDEIEVLLRPPDEVINHDPLRSHSVDVGALQGHQCGDGGRIPATSRHTAASQKIGVG